MSQAFNASTAMKVGSTYNFSVFPSKILGNGFNGVTVEAVVNATMAKKMGCDVYALHAKMYPYVDQGFPNNPDQYNWVYVNTVSGASQWLGEIWIDGSTVNLIVSQTAIVTLPNVSSSDAQNILNALAAAGFANGQIQFQ